mmetsp:Transcript_23607/g.58850  ORF Transcript_23607/g.58850 Transcript_23607/m.58850 type:complete len:265 (+) Transcript_23607:725-1519(+)
MVLLLQLHFPLHHSFCKVGGEGVATTMVAQGSIIAVTIPLVGRVATVELQHSVASPWSARLGALGLLLVNQPIQFLELLEARLRCEALVKVRVLEDSLSHVKIHLGVALAANLVLHVLACWGPALPEVRKVLQRLELTQRAGIAASRAFITLAAALVPQLPASCWCLSGGRGSAGDVLFLHNKEPDLLCACCPVCMDMPGTCHGGRANEQHAHGQHEHKGPRQPGARRGLGLVEQRLVLLGLGLGKIPGQPMRLLDHACGGALR